jgi:hypothetical protein
MGRVGQAHMTTLNTEELAQIQHGTLTTVRSSVSSVSTFNLES